MNYSGNGDADGLFFFIPALISKQALVETDSQQSILRFVRSNFPSQSAAWRWSAGGNIYENSFWSFLLCFSVSIEKIFLLPYLFRLTTVHKMRYNCCTISPVRIVFNQNADIGRRWLNFKHNEFINSSTSGSLVLNFFFWVIFRAFFLIRIGIRFSYGMQKHETRFFRKEVLQGQVQLCYRDRR